MRLWSVSVDRMVDETGRPARFELQWRADRVKALMRRRKIADRSDLAKLMGVARGTVYRAFRPDWSGRATAVVLAQLAGLMRVRPDSVVEVVESSD